jgi:hypothetical protein
VREYDWLNRCHEELLVAWAVLSAAGEECGRDGVFVCEEFGGALEFEADLFCGHFSGRSWVGW